MYLGSRKIRSAGRTSGSIEITLPAQLQVLEGMECRLMVRDGSRPEIVLQPNLSAAQALFQALWQKLGLGLGEMDELDDFSPADFTLALFPPRHWQERPPLAYADALAVHIGRLFAATQAPVEDGDAAIWHSGDGISWVQANPEGFGDPGPEWRGTAMVEFGGAMLLATVSHAPYARGGVRHATGERIAIRFSRISMSSFYITVTALAQPSVAVRPTP